MPRTEVTASARRATVVFIQSHRTLQSQIYTILLLYYRVHIYIYSAGCRCWIDRISAISGTVELTLDGRDVHFANASALRHKGRVQIAFLSFFFLIIIWTRASNSVTRTSSIREVGV